MFLLHFQCANKVDHFHISIWCNAVVRFSINFRFYLLRMGLHTENQRDNKMTFVDQYISYSFLTKRQRHRIQWTLSFTYWRARTNDLLQASIFKLIKTYFKEASFLVCSFIQYSWWKLLSKTFFVFIFEWAN